MPLTPKLVQFHTILNNVLFPIDEKKLIQTLQTNGYQPAQQGQIINGLIIQPGDLAIKNNCILTINTQSKMIQLTGLSPVEVYDTWKELEQILSTFDVNLKSSGRLFELKSEYVISTGKNPLESFQRLKQMTEITSKFNSIISGKPSSSIGLRFVPIDGLVDTEDFYDVTLECLLRNAKKEYFVQILYRNKKQDISEKLLNNLENKIQDIVNIVDNA